MIKGQYISTLMTINDTSGGRMGMWMMIIMLLCLRILYLIAYHLLEQYRYRELILLKNQLECALYQDAEKEAEHEPEVHSIKPEPASQNDSEDDEDREVMDLFEDLKR